MLQKIVAYIKEKNMIETGDHVLVGCSGGADSVCLLLVLLEAREYIDFSVSVLHVEHGIRGADSLEDAHFVMNLCKEKQLACVCVSEDVPLYAANNHLGLEEAARILRYTALRREAQRCQPTMKVALAHHMEDNAETMLFQMARGSGLAGMCGIAPVREEDAVCFIRPLLCASRDEIEHYLSQKGQSYCVDVTNSDETYSRNRIRKSVLPQLVAVNQQAVLHMNQIAEHMTDVYSFVTEQANLWFKQVTVEKAGACTVDCSSLQNAHPLLQKEVLRKALFYVTEQKKDISLVHIDAMLILMKQQSGHRISLPYGVKACMEYQFMRIYKVREKGPVVSKEMVTQQMLIDCRNKREGCMIWQDTQGSCIFAKVWETKQPLLDFSKKTYTKQFDYDKIKKGFCVRTRQKGDYLVLDKKGHRKKLRDYMIDEKIPMSQRDTLPVLAIDNEVIWLIGKRVGESFKVTESTTHIIEIQYNGGNQDESFNNT